MTRKNKRILICATMMHLSFRERISGILRYAGALPDWTCQLFDKDAFDQLTTPDAKANRDADGMILITPVLKSRIDAGGRRKLAIPTVVFNSPENPLSFKPDVMFSVDNTAIARSAFDLFQRRGLKSVAYVGNAQPGETIHSKVRRQTLSDLAHAHGMTFRPFDFNGGENWADELTRLSQWLLRLPIPCGVFAYSDAIAKTVVDASRLSHIRIPTQILLIGVDNDLSICENMQPTLSSVEPDFENAGYRAAEALNAILENGRPRTTVHQAYGVRKIVERASTQDISGSRRIISTALELIRLEAPVSSDFCVDRLCAKLNVSRSLLNRLFRDELNSGVAERIRLVRLNALAERLIKSGETIADICDKTGFRDPFHVKTLFKKHFGMTMREWRRSGIANGLPSS